MAQSTSKAATGGSMFDGGKAPVPAGASTGTPVGDTGAQRGVPVEGITREAQGRRTIGRGPMPVDRRKFKYDRTLGSTMPAVEFGASKVDRLDAADAGELLDRIHRIVGIDREPENVLVAFDKALFTEHTINGASLMQPGRGVITVDETAFDLAMIKSVMGNDQRRFFRAFADEITENNHDIIRKYDPMDPVSAERYGQLQQVAHARGLQKYPHLAHDSSDAGLRLSTEERMALGGSKRLVLEATVNVADRPQQRVNNSVVAGNNVGV